MRSIGLLAAVTGMLVLASACSDGGGTTPPPENTAPVASFVLPSCTIDVACDFASTSTDDAAVTAWSWDFDGDGNPDATTANASFTYTTAGVFNVSLTVRDAEGLSDTKTSSITITTTTTPPENAAPVANFALPSCTINVACDFVSTSTDDAAVTAWSWDFDGDGNADASTANASFTYTTAGAFNVSLTVHDAQGLSNTKTSPITIAAAPVNTPPTAGFTHSCPGAVCTFTSTSTDVAPGTIATYAWTFGDDGTDDVQNPSHSYAITVPMEVTVTLTVTDNEGATDVETQTFTVSPPPPVAEGCTTSGTLVDCAFDVPARSTMKLKLIGLNCDLRKEKVVAPPPISDQVFLGVCGLTAGDELGIFGGPHDELIVYEVGSQVRIRFGQGVTDADHPVLDPPAAHFTGAFPNWTINFEDGADPGGAGEPDFTDIVLGVEATVVP
jgi:PKD repeat protein